LTIPVVPNFSASEVVTATKMTQLRDALAWVYNPPHCYAYKSSDGALTTSVWGNISFGAELYDWSTTPMHDTVTNPSRITVPETALYDIRAFAKFEANANGYRALEIKKNAGGVETAGTQIWQDFKLPSANNVGFVSAAQQWPLTAGDYLEMFCFQNSGGPLNAVGGATTLFMSVQFVSVQ
jgi:hypothetical protein